MVITKEPVAGRGTILEKYSSRTGSATEEVLKVAEITPRE
jgi:hypothetical protein